MFGFWRKARNDQGPQDPSPLPLPPRPLAAAATSKPLRPAAKRAEPQRGGAKAAPETEVITREEWLGHALELLRAELSKRGFVMPRDVRISLGWPRVRGQSAVTYAPEASTEGAIEIFVSPLLSEALEVVDTLTHEVCHAVAGVQAGHRAPFQKVASALGLIGEPASMRGIESARWRAWAEPLARKLGEFPHAAMVPPADWKRSGRLLRLECPVCGWKLRTARKWLDNVAQREMAPRCIDPACGGWLTEEFEKRDKSE